MFKTISHVEAANTSVDTRAVTGNSDAVLAFACIGMSACMAVYHCLSRLGLPDSHLYEAVASFLTFAVLVLVPNVVRNRGILPKLQGKQIGVVAIAALALGVWLAANVMGTKTHDPLSLDLRAVHQGGCDAFF